MASPPHSCAYQYAYLCCKECNDKKRQVRQLRRELTREADPEAVQAVVNQQIELLGSQLLYQRMDANLKRHKFEFLFSREQCKLFDWRLDFFHKFCGNGQLLFDKSGPYHITRNFDAVVALVCSSSDKLEFSLIDYFEENEYQSGNARILYTEGIEYSFQRPDELQDVSLSYNDCAHMIMTLYGTGPCSLLESALKTVKLHNLSLEETPTSIQKKAVNGLYELEDQVPNNLSTWGKELYEDVRSLYLAEAGLQKNV